MARIDLNLSPKRPAQIESTSLKLVSYETDGGRKAGVLVDGPVVDAQTVADGLALTGQWVAVTQPIEYIPRSSYASSLEPLEGVA